MEDKKFSRRKFLFLSAISSFFYSIMPRVKGIKRIGKDAKMPLKKFFLNRSRPVADTSFVKNKTEDGLTIDTDRNGDKKIFRLNETSAFILDCCDGRHTPSDISKELIEHFNVDKRSAGRDVASILEHFYNAGVIKV